LQAKATNETGLLHEALEKYPHIQVAATDEVAGQIADQRVFPSGFDNQELQNRVVQPMEVLSISKSGTDRDPRELLLWRASAEFLDGPVVASSPIDRLELQLLPAL